ncbi:multicopper oxidase family protein [Streptomyces sp. NPDC048231]|uniref:multicopper oxidase family protein n=1 Tax=Streptomyces sp. NPDC048231 TaxID=3365519 RepID=UPI00371B7531
MKIAINAAAPALVRRISGLLPRAERSPGAGSSPQPDEDGEAAGRRQPPSGRFAGVSAVSRRTLVRSIGATGGLAVIAGCTTSEDHLDPRNHGAHPEKGDDGTHGHSGDQHNDNDDNNAGGSWQGLDRSDPNSDIRMLTSQVKLPAQFRSPLPIPEQLKPTKQTSDTDYYEIVQSQAKVEIIPGLKTPIMGYNGTFPGPTIIQNPGRRVVVTHKNDLPVPTVVHLHGGTAPYDSDGYPTDFVLPAESYGNFPTMPAMPGMPAMNDPDAHVSKMQRDYAYPPQPQAGTLWYHDHRMAFTGASVYRGLAGFHIAHGTEEQALPLPRGARDVPLMIADRAFASDGSFLYPALDPTMRTTPGVDKPSVNGVMGDVILVNGAPWPVMKVDTARYRFRILNASNARTYQLGLQGSSQGFTQIGTDHGLLPAPLPQDTVMIAPAERFDVVIDFSRHKVGDEITLVNRLGSNSTAAVMRFLVTRATKDSSSIPSTLSKTVAITPTGSMTQRTMKFTRGHQGQWLINKQAFDPSASQADVRAGSTELWTILSDFHHPFHIHNATFQVMARDGRAPGPNDQGWKDTVFVNKGEKVLLAIRFSDLKGRFVFHCHNLEHEDMAMMATFRIT